MSKTFQVEAVIEGTSPLKDGGFSIRFHTQELKTEQKAVLLEFYQKFGWLLFSESEEMDLPKEQPIRDRSIKTPSQVLRGVLWHCWKNEGRKDIDFDAYYKQELNKVIEMYKNSLPKDY